MAFLAPCIEVCNSLRSTEPAYSRHRNLSKTSSRSQTRNDKLRKATLHMVQTPAREQTPGRQSVNLDWSNLGFEYIPTRAFIRYTYKDGHWSATPEVVTNNPYIHLHIGATALHYGQSCFEGLKAFQCKDGKVRAFRPYDNAKRLQHSAKRLMIPTIPQEMFIDAVLSAVRENIEYVPPYGTGGALYIRPLLFGSGARIGLQPADEYTFLVMVIPVGNYYKTGPAPVTALVMDKYDRTAPKGVGNVKVAANYAADLMPNVMSKNEGYPIQLYLHPLNQRTIEEFGTSNFAALKGNTYITPNSESILNSVTNRTLMQLAQDEGMKVEKREIDIDEVDTFDEVAACGTAVIITPVTRIVKGSKVYEIGKDSNKMGPRFAALYKKVRAIQQGESPDPHNWMVDVNKPTVPSSFQSN